MAIDISGPIRTSTMDRFKYHQTTVLTNTSKYVGTALLKTKDEGAEASIEFNKYLERQTGGKLMSMRTDGAMDYIGLSDFCAKNGIEYIQSNRKNAVVERTHRTVREMASAMLHDAKLLGIRGIAGDIHQKQSTDEDLKLQDAARSNIWYEARPQIH